MMRRALVIALLVVVAIPLLFAVAELPPHGSAETPPYTHVSPYYLENAAEEGGADNVVTAVILNYRGFDTQGEVTVIFTAMAAVVAVLVTSGAVERRPPAETGGTPVSVIVRFIVRVLAPFILVFAVYVILNGHITPGGGFQGGTIIGALVIALTLIMSESRSRALTPRRPERLLQIAAPLAFLGVGCLGLVLYGDYLAFPRQGHGELLVTVMLTVIEFGIGIGGAMVIATIFRTMGAER